MFSPMLARALGLLTTLTATAAVAACSLAPAPRPAREGARRVRTSGALAASGAPARGTPDAAREGARYFHGTADGAFRVTHGGPAAAARDRVVAGGARLEIAGGGRVVAAAWETELWAAGDPVIGSLAIAPRLGGGYLHWTRSRAFRSRDFTGPLAEVAIGGGARAVRGARNGLRDVVIFTDQGPRALPPGEDRGRALEAPALHDLAALDASRAVRLDVFGRAATTADGGATWIDVGRRIGLAARGLGVAPDALAIDTALGRVAVLPDGSLGRPDGDLRAASSASSAFQLVVEGARDGEREAAAAQDLALLAAAVSAGALLPDGTALGVLRGGAARIDARTGAARDRSAGWLPDGLDCAPVRAEDGLLFLCMWDDYEGHGSFVLRSERGEAPRMERAFSDDGFFVADDGGALGFVGGCAAEERYVSDEERDRRFGEVVVHPRICVRRGPGAWVERAVSLGGAEVLVAWAPRRDGGAVALVRGERDALPAPAGAARVHDEGGREGRAARAGSPWLALDAAVARRRAGARRPAAARARRRGRRRVALVGRVARCRPAGEPGRHGRGGRRGRGARAAARSGGDGGDRRSRRARGARRGALRDARSRPHVARRRALAAAAVVVPGRVFGARLRALRRGAARLGRGRPRAGPLRRVRRGGERRRGGRPRRGRGGVLERRRPAAGAAGSAAGAVVRAGRPPGAAAGSGARAWR
ncbi:hypothetical protein [Sorangium cellulosum]|uniref:hypothetical protein n=1 Tax=Sorangium cellulosum TaxID=56 RepID=UPI00133145E8|nr:hypothetical protein [Sorangium cellulosum]